MKTMAIATALLMGCLAGCGHARPPTNASDATEPAETESTESTAPEASEPATPESTEAAEPAATKAEPAESSPAADPGGGNVPCSSLQKSKCKVTQGCAWYEQGGKGKCVNEDEQ